MDYVSAEFGFKNVYGYATALRNSYILGESRGFFLSQSSKAKFLYPAQGCSEEIIDSYFISGVKRHTRAIHYTDQAFIVVRLARYMYYAATLLALTFAQR